MIETSEIEEEFAVSPTDPDYPILSHEWAKTSKGHELMRKYKRLEKACQTQDRVAMHLENEAKKLSLELSRGYYPQDNKSVLKAHEAADQARQKFEKLVSDKKAVWYIIENVLHNWRSISRLPMAVEEAKRKLGELQPKLAKAHRERKYPECVDLAEKVKDLEEVIQSCERAWTSATGDPIPKPPADSPINPAEIAPKTYHERIKSVLRLR